jgi:hypothetical protein
MPDPSGTNILHNHIFRISSRRIDKGKDITEWTRGRDGMVQREKCPKTQAKAQPFDSETAGMIASLCNVIASGFSASMEINRVIHWTMVFIDIYR